MPGYAALVMGVGVLEAIDRLMVLLKIDIEMFIHPQIDFYTALAALGVLSFGGVLAGIMPAFRAIRMKPVEALRQDV